MSKHTPGPWRIERGVDSGKVRGITAADGPITRWHGLATANNDRAEANARLIVAAPDLLETAEQVLETIAAPSWGDHPLHALRAAVDKARGK